MLVYKFLNYFVDLSEVSHDFKQRSLATIKGFLDVVFSRGFPFNLPQEIPLPSLEEEIYRVLLDNIAQHLLLCAH